MLIASVSQPKAASRVTLADGTEVVADVPIVEVELCDETGMMGSRTLRFVTPADKEAALVKYVQGEYIAVEA
jgi:hypothetical protein